MTIRSYLSIKQTSEKYPTFPEGGLRHQRFNQETNGLKELGVFVNVGSRVLIDEENYFLAIELKNTGEFDSVIELMREAKAKGKYLPPEDALMQIRGGAA
jgi:hypothetical protein